MFYALLILSLFALGSSETALECFIRDSLEDHSLDVSKKCEREAYLEVTKAAGAYIKQTNGRRWDKKEVKCRLYIYTLDCLHNVSIAKCGEELREQIYEATVEAKGTFDNWWADESCRELYRQMKFGKTEEPEELKVDPEDEVDHRVRQCFQRLGEDAVYTAAEHCIQDVVMRVLRLNKNRGGISASRGKCLAAMGIVECIIDDFAKQCGMDLKDALFKAIIEDPGFKRQVKIDVSCKEAYELEKKKAGSNMIVY